VEGAGIPSKADVPY